MKLNKKAPQVRSGPRSEGFRCFTAAGAADVHLGMGSGGGGRGGGGSGGSSNGGSTGVWSLGILLSV